MVIGEVIGGRYLLGQLLGRGGMGMVYEAHDSVLERDVAIKILPSQSLGAAIKKRLRREARIVARMDHPCVVPVYDLVDDSAGVYLVMPVLRGLTLRELLDSGPLSVPFTATAGLQIASALVYSHGLGVIHRDIKPDNIMTLGTAPDNLKIKVMDFGVARTIGDTVELEPGKVVGTLEYLSPEQVRGATVDGRSDVYSLGIVLFECLVGRAPFTGSMMDVMHRILCEEPRSLRELDPNIPAVIEELVAGMLRKDPDERPSLEALQKALRQVPGVAAPSGTGVYSNDAVVPSPERIETSDHSSPALAGEATEIVQPLTGREDELYILSSAIARTKRGHLQMCMIAGEPGMGKSRLLMELARVADSRGVPMYLGRCRGRSESLPYHALCEIIQDFCSREVTEDTAVSELRALAAELVSRFPSLTSVPALQRMAQQLDGDSRLRALRAGLGEGTSSLSMLELLARTLVVIGQGRPMIIAVDDLHRSNVSVDALAYLSRRIAATPTMLVATYRPRVSSRVAQFLRTVDNDRMGQSFRRIELAELALESRDELAENALSGEPLDPDTALRLRDASKGNPLAIRSLILGLRDAGALRSQGGTWSVAADHELATRLPSRLHAIIRLRLETLSGDIRGYLARAAILGEPFSEADIALLYPWEVDPPSPNRAIQDEFLVEVGWGRDQRSLAFANNVVREVLEQTLGQRHLTRLHRRYAETLLARKTRPDTQTCHALAYHFAGAGLFEQALEFGIQAARRALYAGGPEQAVRTLRMVLASFDGEDEDEIVAPGVLEEAPTPNAISRTWSAAVQRLMSDARMTLVDALRMLGQNAEARAEAVRARHGYGAVDDRVGQLCALTALAVLDWRERHLRDVLAWVRDGLELERALEPPERDEVGGTLLSLARVGELAAKASGQPAFIAELYDALGHLPEIQDGTDFRLSDPDDSGVLLLDGVELLAQGEYQAALAAVRELESRTGTRTPRQARDEVQQRLQVAELAYQLGHYDETVSHCQTARAWLASEDDEPLLQASLMAWQGLAYSASGRFEEANHTVCDGFAVLATHIDTAPAGRQLPLAQLFRGLGTILLGRGRPSEALRAFERSAQLSQEGSRARSIALFYAGVACADAGRYEEAASYLTQSESAKRKLDDRWGLVQNHAAWVGLLIDRGELAEARARVDAAAELSTSLGAPRIMAWLHWAAGRVHYMYGNADLAERSLQLGLRDAYRCRAMPEANRIHLTLTRAHRAMGHHELAWSHAEQARAMAYSGGSVIEQADAQLRIGLLRMDRGDVAAASEHIENAHVLAESVGNPYRVLDVLMARVEIDIARQRYDDALIRADEVRAQATELGALIHVADTWRAIATLHEKRGDAAQAEAAMRRAESEYQALSLPASGVR